MRIYLYNCFFNRPYDSDEGFDYTKWQREYFGNKPAPEIDYEMEQYFYKHEFTGDTNKIF